MKTAVITLAALLALGFAGAARATFPGANGKIVFETNRNGNADVYTMNPDGTNRINLTHNPAEDVEPRWSPDGSRIAFASNRTGNFEIYTMSAAGGDLQRLTYNGANNRRPSWTAEGTILFHSVADGNRDIYAMKADGSNVRNLAPSPADDAYAAASPRSNRIVFTSNRGGDYHLYLLSGDGPIKQITSGSGAEDFQANWSPNGNDLVFVRLDSTFSSSDLYLLHASGGAPVQLTSTPDRLELEPVWSPDGRKIAFHGCSGLGTDAQHCANYVMNADGTGETEVSTPHAPFLETFDTDLRDPIWQPIQFGTDTSFVQTNGELEFTLGADAQGQFNQIDLHYGLSCSLPGDFDMQVDYKLLEWPAGNGSFAQLAAFFIGAGIFRQSETYGEFYNAYSNFGFNTLLTADRSGSLRFVRSGGRTTASYLDPLAGWVTVLAVSANPGVVVPGLALSSGPNFAHQEVKVAFDNFRITSGTMSCPTWWDDNAPDWQAVR
jgi:Tol biopolymer transport system component